MAYADGWLAPCGLKGNDDDDEKDDKDSEKHFFCRVSGWDSVRPLLLFS